MNDLSLPESDYRRRLREMNDALFVSSVRQHELTEQAENAERALAKALAYANDIIASIRQPLLVLTPDLRVKTANRSFYETFHVTAEETYDRLIYELGNHQWDIPKLRTLLEEILPRNASFEDYAVEHDFPAIGRKTMLLNARRLYREGNHTELILLAIEDITARKQAEAALKISELRYRRLFESAKDGILILDTYTAKIIDANPFISELLGYTRADLLGKELWEIGLFKDKQASKAAVRELQRKQYLRHDHLPLETRAGARLDVEFVSNVYSEGHTSVIQCNIRDVSERRHMAEVLSGKIAEAHDAEVLIDRPDGARVTVVVNIRALKNDRGAITGAVNCFYDVTERKRAEDLLRESEQRLTSLIESSHDAIVSKSLDGIIQSWNQSAERLFGYTAEEAVGRPISIIIPADRADEERRIIARLRAGERVEHFDTVRVRKDGQLVQVALTISPIKDAAGRVIGASKIARDITAQKRLEADLRDADRRKNEFLAMLAHELRNPLAPIRNAVHMIRLQPKNEGAVRAASEIMERQLAQMVHMLEDLLDISRISWGKIELHRGRVELASAVNHAVEATQSLYKGMNHELTVTLPSEPIYLDADPTRLAQIVGNLLNNACKFTDMGGRISLSLQRQGAEAVIRVRDSGIGIAADQLSRIFDMFVQVDASLERSVSGLGIGLSLVKRLVEMHGGTVAVRSAGAGHGSEFVVRLPALPGALKAPAPQPAVTVPPSPTACRILVVDDNRDSADSLAMLLRLGGHETHIAYDGLEAVEAAATFHPHLVLLDIGLPKLNGYEAARRIREQPGGNDIVLIALTGWGQREDRQKSAAAGFNGHTVKPVDLPALTKLIAELRH